MKKNHCTVCTGKCHYSEHVRENKKYVVKTKNIIMTFHELKLEYERTGEKPKTSFDKKSMKILQTSMNEIQEKLRIKQKQKKI